MTGTVRLTGENLHIAEKLLSNVGKLLDDAQIPYWLEGGTLLGIVREQRLLPWDNDLDLSIHAEHLPTLLRAVRTLPRTKYFLRLRRVKKTNNHFKRRTIRMVKIYNTRWFGLRRGEVCLEIFIKYPIDDQSYWMIGRKVKSVPKRFYDALTRIEFKNQSYSIPADTDGYLTFRFGDWRTPKQEWNTFRDDNALVTKQAKSA